MNFGGSRTLILGKYTKVRVWSHVTHANLVFIIWQQCLGEYKKNYSGSFLGSRIVILWVVLGFEFLCSAPKYFWKKSPTFWMFKKLLVSTDGLDKVKPLILYILCIYLFITNPVPKIFKTYIPTPTPSIPPLPNHNPPTQPFAQAS